MTNVNYSADFLKIISKLDESLKIKLKKQIQKIIQTPECGKPMRFDRKGTRELYIPPFRISYVYIKHEDKIVLLDFYHKDEQ